MKLFKLKNEESLSIENCINISIINKLKKDIKAEYKVKDGVLLIEIK